MNNQLVQIEGNSEGPVVVFIPGGPGFSADTLTSMDVLARSYSLAYVHPPGTGGTPSLSVLDFENVVDSLEKTIAQIKRPIVLCGHSFGGLYAIELAHRGNLRCQGLVLIATVLSKPTYELALEPYQRLKTANHRLSDERLDANPSDREFATNLSHYGSMFFAPSSVRSGSEMLARDKMSYASFQKLISTLAIDATNDQVTAKLATLTVPKLFLAGQDEVLFKADDLRGEAEQSGCTFVVIEGASHFLTFDKPAETAAAIETFFQIP